MRLFTLEHNAIEFGADLAVQGAVVVLLIALLVTAAPGERWPAMLMLFASGLLGWSFIEYALHRFVLHGLAPFRHWHARHHRRPTALIYAPTVLTATSIAVLVFLPAVLLCGLWRGCALTLGVSMGYLAYSLTHHAIHQWHIGSGWLKQRQLWHALHHRPVHHPGHYGVTTTFWDHVFGTTGVSPRRRQALKELNPIP